jgi:hypothetical protein
MSMRRAIFPTDAISGQLGDIHILLMKGILHEDKTENYISTIAALLTSEDSEAVDALKSKLDYLAVQNIDVLFKLLLHNLLPRDSYAGLAKNTTVQANVVRKFASLSKADLCIALATYEATPMGTHRLFMTSHPALSSIYHHYVKETLGDQHAIQATIVKQQVKPPAYAPPLNEPPPKYQPAATMIPVITSQEKVTAAPASMLFPAVPNTVLQSTQVSNPKKGAVLL